MIQSKEPKNHSLFGSFEINDAHLL